MGTGNAWKFPQSRERQGVRNTGIYRCVWSCMLFKWATRCNSSSEKSLLKEDCLVNGKEFYKLFEFVSCLHAPSNQFLEIVFCFVSALSVGGVTIQKVDLPLHPPSSVDTDPQHLPDIRLWEAPVCSVWLVNRAAHPTPSSAAGPPSRVSLPVQCPLVAESAVCGRVDARQRWVPLVGSGARSSVMPRAETTVCCRPGLRSCRARENLPSDVRAANCPLSAN